MLKRNIREEITIEYFFKHPTMYIKEISKVLKIPRSTIERYLKKHEMDYIPNLNITVGEQLKINKVQGNRKGGNQTFKTHISLKDDTGKFTGLEKEDTVDDKELLKEKDILDVTRYFLEHNNLTINELANVFNYTRDYIYDLLTSNKTKEILGEDLFKKIQILLSRNQKSFNRKKDDLDLSDISYDILDSIEYEIINLRCNEDMTQEEIGRKLNLSKTRIMEIENRALKKLQEERIKLK